MATHDDPRNQYEKNVRDMKAAEDIARPDKEAIEEFLKSIDPEDYTHTFTNNGGKQETKSVGTVHSYAHNLKRVSEISGTPLTQVDSAEEINELMDKVRSGSHPHPSVKSSGYSAGTLKGWQSAVSKFYQYHDDHNVVPTDIVIAKQEHTSVDDRDMYTVDEVNALRDACDHPRDRALLELLLNTGQRLRAIQTLRIKDVDTEEGIYYLNDDVDGLKGADENGSKRPLLGAKQAVFDWLQYHPCSDDPEAALITKQPGHSRGTAGEEIAQSTIRRALKKIADNADVNKPPNPHNFRHYFVTTCKRSYGMDDATIKHLIGHAPDSTVMETTYQHLTDEDHIREAEIKAGVREPEEEDSPLTPDVCPTCGNHLEPDARACSRCGAVFTPDAKSAEDQIDQDMQDSYREVDPEDMDTQEKVDALDDLLDDPDVKSALLEKIGEE